MEKQVNLLTYQSIKTVKAAKITDIIVDSDPRSPLGRSGQLITDSGCIAVYGDYLFHHKPQVGGYYVQYADGYESYSPASAFEKGYFLMGEKVGLSFSCALDLIKKGNRVQRLNWSGAGQWVMLMQPSAASFKEGVINLPIKECIGLKNAQGEVQPGWVPSIGDLLAEDWQQVEDVTQTALLNRY